MYDLRRNILSKNEMNKKVFSLEWIDDNHIISVIGSHSDDEAKIRFGDFFQILNYSLLDGTFYVIEEQNNHEPITIVPKLSPSKQSILFSEYKLYSGNNIKLIALDGKTEKTITDGVLPYWGVKEVK